MPERETTAPAWTPSVACVVLAAGGGSRFGAPGDKLLAPVRGKPLLQWSVDAACASCATTCSLIVGAAADRVIAAIEPRRAAIRRNDGWEAGLASTIRTAIDVHRDADACLFVLGDAPNVCADDLNRLIATWIPRPSSIVALRAAHVWGAPIIFGRAYFGELAALRGDAGAKRLAQSHSQQLVFVDALSGHPFADVDRPGDLTRRGASKRRGTRPSPRARRSRPR